jgi:hypothetical protein
MYALPARNADGSQDLAALLFAPNSIDTILPAAAQPDLDGGSDAAAQPEQPSAILLNARRMHRSTDGASRQSTGDNRVQITLDTEYPFGESLQFAVVAEKGFKLRLRIPAWAAAVATYVLKPAGSDVPTAATPAADGFHT